METSLLEGPVLFLESEPPPAKHIQILFVEDHEDTARVLGRILRNAGFEVSHAGTVAQARTLAEQQYASEQRRFEAGTSTVFLVLQRQTAMIASRTQFARTETELSRSTAQLRRAFGIATHF